MSRLALPEVTLCAVDGRTPALALASLARSRAQVDFARSVLFTDLRHPMPPPPEGIELVDAGPLDSSAAYSRFVLRALPAHVHSAHVLVTQWDGFVVNPAAWRDEFLQWDYIGAVWPDMPAAHSVGNGGFSLRSQRLLRAGLDERITELHPEDLMLCRRHRALLERDHGVRFAPPELARTFAYENEKPTAPTFGFHGPKNLPAALDAATLQAWLALLPEDFFRSRDARRLARALLSHRMPQVAADLLRRRQSVGRREPATLVLAAAAALMNRLSHGR